MNLDWNLNPVFVISINIPAETSSISNLLKPLLALFPTIYLALNASISFYISNTTKETVSILSNPLIHRLRATSPCLSELE
jgi:hypothetical protein